MKALLDTQTKEKLFQQLLKASARKPDAVQIAKNKARDKREAKQKASTETLHKDLMAIINQAKLDGKII